MEIRCKAKPSKNSVLIYPVFEKGGVPDAGLRKALEELKKSREFEGTDGQTLFLFGKVKSLPQKIVLLGLGEEKKLTVSGVMAAFGTATKNALSHRPSGLSIHFPPALGQFAQAISEAVIMASYQPSKKYKTGEAQKKLQEKSVAEVEVVMKSKDIQAKAGAGWVSPGQTEKEIKKGAIIASLMNELRDWVNAPPNYANAHFFDEKAHEIAKETGAKLTILKQKELEKLNMGALLGVNRGSHDEGRLTTLEYKPAGIDTKEPPLVFVGKGIIFDSGGYNLKPRGHIEDMQLDKAGAAAVLMLIRAAHKLGIKRHIIAVAPFTENLIGGHAMKPSEILTTYSGKTIEVTNTDGEGRLILADAIAYAVDQFKPTYLIDVATLTGACMVALGDRYVGLFGNDKELGEKLRAAGDEVDELFWPMPLHKDHSEKMKGVYADLRNADLGSERDAGASKGAAFIQEFVGKTKWAHLDVAGTAWTSDPKKYESKGATGNPLRALIRFLEKF